MITIPQYTRVSLIGMNGSVLHFDSIPDTRAALSKAWVVRHVGRHFKVQAGFRWHVLDVATGEPPCAWREPVFETYPFILLDSVGRTLTAEDLGYPARRRKAKVRVAAPYRGGPVPGKGRRHGGHAFRRIASVNERRWAEPVVEEGEVAPRIRRNKNNLPNAWDDYGVAAREDRSWKRFRRTQWR